MELGGILHVARRWWTTLVLAMCLAGLAGYYAASQAPQTYSSQVKILVGPFNTDDKTQEASGQLATTYAQLVQSRSLIDPMIQALQLPMTAEQLQGNVTAAADADTRILIISVADRDAARSAQIANELAAQLGQRTGATVADPNGALVPRQEGLTTVIEAAAPGLPTDSRSSLIVLLSAIAGTLGVFALLLVFENLNETIRSESELSELTGAELLGSMPARARGRSDRALIVETNPDSARAAAHRLIATKIELSAGERPVRSVLIVGARSSSLSAELTGNVAMVLAGRRRRVVIIDANSDTAEVTLMFGQQQRPGLAELTQWLEQIDRGDGSGVSVAPFVHALNPRLDIMPLGQSAEAQPSEVTLAPWLINRLLESADLVLVNAPPIDRSSAALICARTVDATVLVIRPDRIKREELRRVLQTLRLVGANVIGTVLEQARTSRNGASQDVGGGGKVVTPMRLWSGAEDEKEPSRGLTP